MARVAAVLQARHVSTVDTSITAPNGTGPPKGPRTKARSAIDTTTATGGVPNG